MMKRIALCIVVTCLAISGAFGQSQLSDKGQKSDLVLDKIAKMDVLNFVLPLAMSKEQLRQLLPVLEKIRQRVRKVQELEADELRKLEPDIDKAIKDASDKGLMPSGELRKNIASLFKKFALNRQINIDLNTDDLQKTLEGIWNAGQKKTAANALNMKDYDPNAKVEEMKDEDKIRVFVREIMLNPMAYDILVKLSI
jgi:hypothetical protein